MGHFSLLLVAFLLLSSGCSGSGDNGGNQGNNKNDNNFNIKNRVIWDSVPSEFNPKIEDNEFKLNGAEIVEVDMFGFDDDVEVVYSKDIDANTVILRTYTVYKKSASWGGLNKKVVGNTLRLKRYGSYQCSINIKNGSITDLVGGCYVRLQIFVPQSLELEVYNVGYLLTKRFFAISTEAFLDKFEDATWADDKFEVIEEYIHSYKDLLSSPELVTNELEFVLKDFSRRDNKFKALRRLHSFVSDRENFEMMIENVFISSWDQDEAKKIVGL